MAAFEPPQELCRFAEADDCSDDTRRAEDGPPNSDEASKPPFISRGTTSSNPFPSSEESIANLTFGGSSAAGGDVSGTRGSSEVKVLYPI